RRCAPGLDQRPRRLRDLLRILGLHHPPQHPPSHRRSRFSGRPPIPDPTTIATTAAPCRSTNGRLVTCQTTSRDRPHTLRRSPAPTPLPHQLARSRKPTTGRKTAPRKANRAPRL